MRCCRSLLANPRLASQIVTSQPVVDDDSASEDEQPTAVTRKGRWSDEEGKSLA